MSGDIALEHDTERGVVREGRRVVAHAVNEVPTLGKLEEFPEDVDGEVEGFCGVAEMVLGLDPVEKLEGAVPVVVEGDEGFANGGGVDMDGIIWNWSVRCCVLGGMIALLG